MLEELETVVDRLTAPPWLFSLALAAFAAGRVWRSRLARGVPALAVAALVAVTLVVLGMGDAELRRRILHPERLPVLVLLLGTVLVLWRSRRPATGPEGEQRMAFTAADAVAGTVAVLTLLLCARLWPATLGAMANPEVRPNPARAPWFLAGLQEYGLYFDPLVAGLVLPLLFLGGLLALPYLDVAGHSRDVVTLFLCGWLLLWLLPIVVGTFLRGPHWIAFGLFEPWDPSRPAPLPPPALSEIVWVRWLRIGPPPAWWARELPGLLLLVGYFGLLPWQLARLKIVRGILAPYHDALGRWRFRVAAVWLLALLLVPLKMYSRWFGVGYWIDLPELFFRF